MHKVIAIASHAAEMGRPEHDGAASPFGFGQSPPLSGASSPSPLLPAPNHAKTRFAGRRRHAVVRLICSPFAAVFGTACSAGAAAAHDDDRATRRPSLEELLRMETSSSDDLLDVKQPNEPAEMVHPYDDDDEGSWKQSAIVVFDLSQDGDKNRRIEDEKDEAPLAVSEDQHGAMTSPDSEKEPAEELDAGGGGGAMLSPKALVNVERLVVVLASLGARSRALKGSYGRLAAGRRVGGAGDGKAELFYDRPIPLGRRCRVQHLEESPYL